MDSQCSLRKLAGLDEEKLWNFITHEVGLKRATAVACLLCPKFVEVRNCVILAEHYEPSNFEEWFAKLNGEPLQIEGVLNHLHLWDLFDPEMEQLPSELLDEFGRVVERCWRRELAERYPHRTFKIELRFDEEDYGPTIYCYQAT